MRIIYEPGITSIAFLEATLIFPFITPLYSHADLAVYAVISFDHTSGLLVSKLIVYLGF